MMNYAVLRNLAVHSLNCIHVRLLMKDVVGFLMLCYSSCTLIELETEHMFIYIKNLVDGVHDTAAHSGKEMRTCLKHFKNLFVVKSRSS